MTHRNTGISDAPEQLPREYASLSALMVQAKRGASILNVGNLPASWTKFAGTNGEPRPFTVTTSDLLPGRVQTNIRVYYHNYALLGLAAGVARVLLSPSLLFLSGVVTLGWFGYMNRSYVACKVPQVYYFRAVGALTFGALCLVGPAALSWGFGVGGSLAVAHACLRSSDDTARKDDDVGESGYLLRSSDHGGDDDDKLTRRTELGLGAEDLSTAQETWAAGDGGGGKATAVRQDSGRGDMISFLGGKHGGSGGGDNDGDDAGGEEGGKSSGVGQSPVDDDLEALLQHGRNHPGDILSPLRGGDI